MQKGILVFLFGLYVTVAFAQDVVAIEIRSSNPLGLQIHENTKINNKAQNTILVSTGESNSGKTFTSATRSEIMANTKTDAQATNLHAVSIGQSNAAKNNIGTIGGK